MMPQGTTRGEGFLPAGFPAAAAYAAYGRGYPFATNYYFPGFGLPLASAAATTRGSMRSGRAGASYVGYRPSGLPSYGYMPAAAHTVGAGDRVPAAAAAAAAAAYYTDYVTIPTHPHMTGQMASQMATVPVSAALGQRNDQSPIPISTSPLHRDHFSARGIGNAVMTSGGVLSMMNNYPGAAQSYGPPTSPANSRGFPPASSPGALDMYSGQDSIGYVQAASPQPAGFPSIAGTLIPAAFHNGFH
ncbi:hypothetical protein NP493_210g02002 [Ridgeia piscesae]|uniref:Uncharacterized protein n=1 Tax=Ridgeia piscesae TaxID=27915 RepID=A0AAD9P142_RIDPI|nr:hypothetical protein NP493_210g02002 [Ridgeia piscesae]